MDDGEIERDREHIRTAGGGGGLKEGFWLM